jgi:exopolyphosphatase / guanosine-5'-triphosphate,3'-diphosphate pyrophosphatase
LNFAAIDIGSNAVRLLFSNVTEDKDKTHFHKAALVRMPVRLGSDSFVRGAITNEKKTDLVKTMIAYRNLIDVYRVEDYMACATSALREASNANEIVNEVKKKANIDIQIIDGELEAELIYATHAAEDIDPDKSYLYVDVGGGSTELTLFSRGKRIIARSFRIGTIRLLENVVSPEEWDELELWIKTHIAAFDDLTGIGTGGNINKLFKLANRKEGKPLFRNTLSYYQRYLSSFSYDERISVLGLRPDRADVIIPAIQVYSQVMKWAGIKEIFVPKVGVADGMVRMLYDKYLGKKKI